MNKQRLERKLEFLIDTFEEEKKKSEKIHLLSKINEIEKVLGLELTTMDLPRVENKKDYYIPATQLNKAFEDSLTPDERAYMKQYEEWRKQKIELVKREIKQEKGVRVDCNYSLDELLIALNKGERIMDIAKRFGVHFTAIAKAKKKHFNLVYKVIEGKIYQKRGNRPHDLTPHLLALLLTSGLTDTAVAKEYGLTQATVSAMKNKCLYKVYTLKERKL